MWNVVINIYGQSGQWATATSLWMQMQQHNVAPTSSTYTITMNALVKGFDKLSTPPTDLLASSKDIAAHVRKQLPTCDLNVWNTLINLYVHSGSPEQAIFVWNEMLLQNMQPDSVTYICCLAACSKIGTSSFSFGKTVHGHLVQQGATPNSIELSTALITMYGKCGRVDMVEPIFQRLIQKDISAWNALISVYAEHGLGNLACEAFTCLVRDGFQPNASTFVSLLNACAHAGIIHSLTHTQ